jgi:acyl carrier protein
VARRGGFRAWVFSGRKMGMEGTMTISTRTPEGFPQRCPICGRSSALEPSFPGGDVVCPACGQLLWVVRDHAERASLSVEELLRDTWLSDELGRASLGLVELVMKLEETAGVDIPDTVSFASLRELIEYLRRQQDERDRP